MHTYTLHIYNSIQRVLWNEHLPYLPIWPKRFVLVWKRMLWVNPQRDLYWKIEQMAVWLCLTVSGTGIHPIDLGKFCYILYVITTPKCFGYLGRISLLNYLAFKKKTWQKLRNIAGNTPTFHARFTDICYDCTSLHPCNMTWHLKITGWHEAKHRPLVVSVLWINAVCILDGSLILSYWMDNSDLFVAVMLLNGRP